MNRKKFLYTMAFLGMMPSLAMAQSGAEGTFSSGLKANSKAPQFVLSNAENEKVELKGLLMKPETEWTALLFYRSADW